MIVINLIQMGSYNNCDYSHSNGQVYSGSSQEVASYCYYGKYSRLYLSPYTEMVNEQCTLYKYSVTHNKSYTVVYKR